LLRLRSHCILTLIILLTIAMTLNADWQQDTEQTFTQAEANTTSPPQSITANIANKFYGWIDIPFVVKSGIYRLRTWPTNHTEYTFRMPALYSTNQYFTLENRQRVASLTDSTMPSTRSSRAYELYAYKPDGDVGNNGGIAFVYYGSSAINISTTTGNISLFINMRNEPLNVDSSINTDNNTVTICWDAPSLWGTPARYRVYRNGDLLSQNNLQASLTSFTDNAPQNGNNTYTVTAIYDGSSANNYLKGESAHSIPTTQIVQLWDIPHDFTATDHVSYVTLQWIATNQTGITILGYNIYRNGVLLTEPTNALTYNDTSVQIGITYTYHVTTVYDVGESLPSDAVSLTIVPPTPPANLTATNNHSHISLTWEAIEHLGITLQGYKVYRNDEAITGLLDTPSFHDKSILLATEYTYKVSAIYDAGESAPSNTITIATSSPNPPHNLTATPQNGYITLSWEAPTENTIPVTMVGYLVYRNEMAISDTLTATIYHNIGTITSTTYTYTVATVYNIGISIQSTSASAASHAPFPPQNLTINNRPGSIILSWERPIVTPNAASLTAYNIYRKRNDTANNPQVIQTLPATILKVSDTRVSAGYTYTYHVVAVYNSTVDSPYSNSVTVTAIQSDAWLPPEDLSATNTYNSIKLTWIAPSFTEQSATFAGYIICRNDTIISEPIQTLEYIDRDITPHQAYKYYVTASYTSPDGYSDPSNIITATLPLHPPQNLIASPAIGQITLSWEHPPHDPDDAYISGWYVVYRDGVAISDTADNEFPDGNLFIDDDVTYPKQYTYYVVTALPNREIYSQPSETVTLAPLEAPSPVFPPPTQLTAQAGNATVRLSWVPPEVELFATLDGYIIYRDALQIATSIDPTFDDNVVINDTQYTYYVVAKYIDPIGESLPTAIVTATPANNDLNDTQTITQTLLHANYPNPFNPETTISYSLLRDSKVQIDIYNARGQLVKQLVNRPMTAGRHTVVWNGKDNFENTVSSGIYFYRMTTGDFSSMRKMLLIK